MGPKATTKKHEPQSAQRTPRMIQGIRKLEKIEREENISYDVVYLFYWM